MRSNIILAIVIIVAGLILGVVLSLSTGQKKTVPQESSSQIPEKAEPKTQVTLTASPQSVKAVGEGKNVKTQIDEIPKTTLSISTPEKTDLGGSKIRILYSNKHEIGVSSSRNTKMDPDAVADDKSFTFIVALDTQTANIYLFSYQPDKVRVHAEVESLVGEVMISNPIELTFN